MARETAALLCSIDVIELELVAMRRVIDESADLSATTRRALVASLHELRTVTTRLSNWLAEAPLDEPTH